LDEWTLVGWFVLKNGPSLVGRLIRSLACFQTITHTQTINQQIKQPNIRVQPTKVLGAHGAASEGKRGCADGEEAGKSVDRGSGE
jgi:hypothetical protein